MTFDAFNPLQVFSKPDTLKIIGISPRTWDRLEALGETPPKTRLSQNRVGYRASDIREWLDARRLSDAQREERRQANIIKTRRAMQPEKVACGTP